ncbi:MAG TPA: hypothetical protein VHK64_08515 [Nocardioidaceae bacterium]|nr:hypothetical protein [Nocardioidaceae bacterium]
MNFIPQYVGYLLPAQASACTRVGTDVYTIPLDLYAVNLSLLTLIGVMMKALNDKGVVLDAEWLDRLNHALDGTWDPNILAQVRP